jgi:hypothetical protein
LTYPQSSLSHVSACLKDCGGTLINTFSSFSF